MNAALLVIGIASWYGPGFHGRVTANGEIYNQYGISAASRTLPLGSCARVTSTRTGKTVDVRVNDRGPYVGKRIIDLSYGAAKQLGMIERGLELVEVVPIDCEKRIIVKEKLCQFQEVEFVGYEPCTPDLGKPQLGYAISL
jgi:rare lipoprotein A